MSCECEVDVRELADDDCVTCEGQGSYPTRGDYCTVWVRCPCTYKQEDDEESLE